MKKAYILPVLLTALLFFSCKTVPPVSAEPDNQAVETHGNITQTETKPDATSSDDNAIVAQFDTVKITRQTVKIAKSEIQLVVEDLNKITYTRDYSRWLTYLSAEYKAEFSNPATLETVSANLPTKGVKLGSLKDYFTYVFVPSRQNMRVDDIKFVSPTRVYVIMEIAPKSPAAIYILEKTGTEWKLVPKNQ